MFNKLFDDFDYDSGMLNGEDPQDADDTPDYGDSYDYWDDTPDWKEDSGWNDVYGSDVEASDIIEFGDGIYGAEAASQHYFGHSAKTLSRNEAAQLAATLPSPLKRNPAHPSSYFRRRTADIQSRFGWGKVNLDKPDPKKVKKYENQETLWDFIKWYYEKE